MKEATLYTIKEEKILVSSDYYKIQNLSSFDNMVINEPDEIVVSDIEIENIPIKKVRKGFVEWYVAIPKITFETLALFENPVTVASLTEERDKIKEEVAKWKSEAKRMGRYRRELREYCDNATLWQRIKWVFTGFSHS